MRAFLLVVQTSNLIDPLIPGPRVPGHGLVVTGMQRKLRFRLFFEINPSEVRIFGDRVDPFQIPEAQRGDRSELLSWVECSHGPHLVTGNTHFPSDAYTISLHEANSCKARVRDMTQHQSQPRKGAPVVIACKQRWGPGVSESSSCSGERTRRWATVHHHHYHWRIPLTVELSGSRQPCGNICIAVAPCFMKLSEYAGRWSERVATASAGDSDNEQQIGPSGPVHAKNDI